MKSLRLPDFAKLRVAVVGDLIADHWLHAQPTRLSREAPVMVLRHVSDSLGAGGALLGVVGRDPHGRELMRLLEGEGVDTVDIVSIAGWTTPTKTRVLA